ncbi:MAG: hypothetical protein GY948_15825 [Alphaproteobacteria bacterium]|nr:hypothetical protein [Alphaproteobacteria bacterium]
MNTANNTQNHSEFAVMIRRTIAVVALTAAVIATASSASAEKIADLTSGDWTGGAFTHSHTGAFSHCAVNAKYKSGIALYFSVTGTRRWSMAFASKHWEFQRGRKYPLHYQIDNGPVLKGTAIARSPSLVQVFLPINGRIFSRFAGGSTLRVSTNRKVMQFVLTGARAMLPKLINCASQHAGKAGADPHSPTGNIQQPVVRSRSSEPLI